MADAMVSGLLDQLASIILEKVEGKMRLVMGVGTEVENLRNNLQAIRDVLIDAEKRQLKEENVKRWLDDLKGVTYDIDDVLDEWSILILQPNINEKDENGVQTVEISKKKVCLSFLFPCFPSKQVNQTGLRLEIATKIKELNGKLDNIAITRDRYKFDIMRVTDEPSRPTTTSMINVFEVTGRNEDKENLINKLLNESSRGRRDHLIVSIVGMGGIGKTTLAQLAFNEIKSKFDNGIWVCVSDPFDETKIVKAIIEQLMGEETKLVELEALMQKLVESIKGKKFLLVLDDVWTYDYRKWEPLKATLQHGAFGSRILVTTQKKDVALRIGEGAHMIELKRLSKEDCWRLFNRVAFLGKDKADEKSFEEIGRKIAAKCDGLPLAAKTLGSHMYFKTTKKEWEDVLESELWDLDDTNMKLFSPLLLSYYDLPSTVKRCFSYCAVFPKDALIDRDDLIQQWMSQGYFNSKKNMEKEAAGLECFNSLVMLSFFQDFEEDMERNVLQCKMHDVVHNFAQFLTKNEYYSIREMENVNQIHGGDIRHLTLATSCTSTEVPTSILKGGSLHTLVVSGIEAIGHDQFLHMKYLRTLNLTGYNTELPEIIGVLVHLRYLNLSNNRRLKELPTSVGKLWNLQTLRLVHCLNIEKLPGTVGQLINLRHLYASYSYNLKQWPKEIGRLGCLRTLNGFQCFGDDDDAKYDHETSLGALRNLNNLHQLYIRGLGDAENHVEEAKQAQLHSKKGLLHLALYFSDRESTMKIHEKVLQELNPHPNIQNLTIKQYDGLVFPSWMISLNNLKRLHLAFCSCEVLPPLGKLPCLESLKMIDMSNVVKVGPEFLGIEEVDHDGYLESSNVVSFPNLKELEFHFFDEWKEWVGTNPEGWKFENPTVIIMPRLQFLNISYCDNLEALPNFLARVSLQNLSIRTCPKLKMRRRKEWAKVCHIPNIAVDELRIVVDRIREGSAS